MRKMRIASRIAGEPAGRNTPAADTGWRRLMRSSLVIRSQAVPFCENPMDRRVSAFPEQSESLYSQWSFAELIQPCRIQRGEWDDAVPALAAAANRETSL